jgi:two-component system NtrC family sensor kinase
MSTKPEGHRTYRVLIIDDNRKIHDDIRKILAADRLPSAIDQMFSPGEETPLPSTSFDIDSAYQGDEGVELILQAKEEGRPYALAFLDMRMPPGIDGCETLKKLWRMENDLQVVVCTAYSDYQWEQIAATTGPTARLVILRKPFECIEVLQLAHALTEKWRLDREARRELEELRHEVAERTQELAESHAVFQLIVENSVQRLGR